MNEKSTPVLSKVLASLCQASLSGFNFLAMLVCVISIVYARDSLASNVSFLRIFLGPVTEIITGYVVQAVSGLTWLFVLVNTALSLTLLIFAIIIRNTKRPVPKQAYS